MKRTGPLVAEIFLGKVSRRNDRRIAELNPGVKLPNLPVAPVYRAEASRPRSGSPTSFPR
ncbi:MAG: hypothetical protein NZM07_05545 [Elioraea sp.]|nr:hypothetical protein [Elioraea sp.]